MFVCGGVACCTTAFVVGRLFRKGEMMKRFSLFSLAVCTALLAVDAVQARGRRCGSCCYPVCNFYYYGTASSCHGGDPGVGDQGDDQDPMLKPPPPPPPAGDKDASSSGAEALLEVELPEDAILFIDGHRTHSTSAKRLFETPPLAPGEYCYFLRAQLPQGGAITQKAIMRPGQTTRIKLSDATSREISASR